MNPTVVEERDIPEDVRSRSALEYDYADLFTVSTREGAEGSPEAWARAAIEGAAGLGGQFIYRVVLGLRLRSSPERVGGWKVADGGDTWIRLEAASWSMTAHIVVQVGDRRSSVGTFIRYDRRIASRMWPPLSAVHRRLMPGLLRQTVRSLDAAPRPRPDRTGGG